MHITLMTLLLKIACKKVREMWESKVSSTNRVENKHYSTLTIFNESVSKDDLDALEKEYNSGVKQIVFVRKD